MMRTPKESELVEKGTLLIGIEHGGRTHRSFMLRPQMVKDTIESMEDARAQKNDPYFGLCLLARQIEILGDIPKKGITPELLLGLYDEDLKLLHAAKERLEKRLASFREEGQAPEETAPGAS